MKYFIKNKHWKLNEEYDIDKILYLLIDRPNIINYHKDFLWENNKGQFHREYDLPAIISSYSIVWQWQDLFHRENNKPAAILIDGYKEYWKNGRRIKSK